MARRLLTFAALAAVAASEEPSNWHNPFHRHNETTVTTTLPSFMQANRAFAGGFADGLGISDDRSCFKGSHKTIDALEVAVKDYLKGDWLDKAKAVAKLGEAVKDIVLLLGTCSKSVDAGVKYSKLLKNLEDPKYYSMHNAAVLCLHFAEDHNQLAQFAGAWEKGHYHEAGFQIATTLLDVLEHPGLPDTNGAAALDFAAGVAEGFSGAVDIGCFRFKDASVEIGAVAGGVADLLTVIEIPRGLASLFQGLTGLVPLYKECMGDRTEIMQLLKQMKDLRHPAELARDVGHNIEVSGLDISLEAATAFLDFKGKSWKRFGEDVGAILSKLFVPSASAATAAIVV